VVNLKSHTEVNFVVTHVINVQPRSWRHNTVIIDYQPAAATRVITQSCRNVNASPSCSDMHVTFPKCCRLLLS